MPLEISIETMYSWCNRFKREGTKFEINILIEFRTPLLELLLVSECTIVLFEIFKTMNDFAETV